MKNLLDEINQKIQAVKSKYLDDDQLWYCCVHGLSTDKQDYTEYELQVIKSKALEEIEKNKINNSAKVQKILSNKY